MARVGIYAGTFDPVHNGHIMFALVAARVAKLEKVVFLPEAQPRNKTKVTDLTHRLEMLRLAAKDYPIIEVVSIDKPQFDVSGTLPILRQEYGEELVMLLGSDVASSLQSWPNSQQLFAQTELIIALRNGDSPASWQLPLAVAGARFSCIPSPQQDISSRHIRSQHQRHHLPDKVIDYITANRLYTLATTANKRYT